MFFGLGNKSLFLCEKRAKINRSGREGDEVANIVILEYQNYECYSTPVCFCSLVIKKTITKSDSHFFYHHIFR